MHTYNLYGWYADDQFPGRVATEPNNLSLTETVGEMRANWTGYEWVDLPYQAPAPAPPAEPEPQRITRLAFRNRFTLAEKTALELAALDNPSAPMPERVQAATLRAYLADVVAATFIDLARPDTRAGVQMLEAAGLLAEGRALVILDAEITPEEHPL